MTQLSALVVARNEETFVRICLEHLLPYVDEVVFLDHQSSDATLANLPKDEKIKVFTYPYSEPVNMGEVRTFALSKVTSDFVLFVDCDEIYPKESMEKIREFIETADEKGFISARFSYKNLAWRSGYIQSDFGHLPDRIYRTDVLEGAKGVLPIDMWYVKKEYLLNPNKTKGDIGPLEYDHPDDISFVHPKQPILKDIFFYHLARTKGYAAEYKKWYKYNRNMHPESSPEELDRLTRVNQWCSGLYSIEPHIPPVGIPTKTIPNPSVALIVTNFEYEKYVGEAIESCLNQTYKNCSVLVIDDHSYDHSRDVIDKYPVTKIYRTYNSGPGTARNDGVSRTTSDFFICLDADDRMKPNAVEELVKEAMRTNAEVIYSDLEFIGEKEGVWKFPDYTPEGMLQASLIPSCFALVDRHVFDVSGGWRHDVLFEDWYMWLTLSHTLKLKFSHIPIPLLEYRDHHSTQKCRSDFGNAHREEAMVEFRKVFPMQC